MMIIYPQAKIIAPGNRYASASDAESGCRYALH